MPTPSCPVAGTAGYADEAHASVLAQQYENIRFDELHRDVLPLFPPPPADVLDIGAGSGRDAAELVRRGYRVMAAEPARALRLEGQRLHTDVPIEWIDDALPQLAKLRALGRHFDLILLTAVWMHLDAQERAQGMPAVASLLAPGGTVVMSLRHGPVPAGRRMFEVSAEETLALARAAGLAERYRGARADVQQRSDVSWRIVAMTKPAQARR